MLEKKRVPGLHHSTPAFEEYKRHFLVRWDALESKQLRTPSVFFGRVIHHYSATTDCRSFFSFCQRLLQKAGLPVGSQVLARLLAPVMVDKGIPIMVLAPEAERQLDELQPTAMILKLSQQKPYGWELIKDGL